jgi:hypothetical protein
MKLLRKSSFHIETDGYGVSIHYKTGKPLDKKSKKWKPVAKDEDVVFCKSYDSRRRVIGVDPGRINTISTAEVLPDGTVEKLTVTKKQYYQECGINVRKRKSAKWQKEIEPFESIFAETSPKTSSYDICEKHTDNYENVKEELWEAKTQRKLRRERFRSYVLKQKFLDRLANKLIGPDKDNPPVLAYGDAKFNATGKFESSPGPTTWIAKELSKRIDMEFIDEYYTSQICNGCKHFLHSVIDIAKDRKITNIRGLKWCSTLSGSESKTCFNLRNRDCNAALNIREIFISINRGEGRPLCLSRRRSEDKPVDLNKNNMVLLKAKRGKDVSRIPRTII